MTRFHSHIPYLAGAAYALAVTAWVAFAFDTLPPRFMDLYLIGIAVVCGRWSKNPALFLYLLSLVFSTWLLPPRGFGAPVEPYFGFRMSSYSVTCAVVIFIVDNSKRRSP